MSRREVLFAGLCLCCVPHGGFSAEHISLEEVDVGVFIRRGPHAEATADNHNGIANIGFIVGEESVLVTDPGGSLADGQWLRAEILKRTNRPIRHVVISHVHPDHAMGAASFEEDEPDFIGHAGLAASLEARGEFYRERLIDILGPEDTGHVVMPTREVGPDGLEIDLGGRMVRCTAHDAAHTSCDLSLIDVKSGILFAGDLLFVGRVPSLDGSLLGWLDQVQILRSLGISRTVPGHGPAMVETAPAFADLEHYLKVLRDETREAIAGGKTIEDAVETVAQTERGKWALFDEYNGRNVIQAYKELEWE